MTSPNALARHHGQGIPGTCSSPRINKQAPKYYAHPVDGFPVTSGGTTAITKGGKHRKARLLNNLHWSANCPLLLPWQSQLDIMSLLCPSQPRLPPRGHVMVPPSPILIQRRPGLIPPRNPILEEGRLIPLTIMKMTRN